MVRRQQVFIWSGFLISWFVAYTIGLFIFLTLWNQTPTHSNSKQTTVLGRARTNRVDFSCLAPERKRNKLHLTEAEHMESSEFDPSIKDFLLQKLREKMMKKQNLSPTRHFGFNISKSDSLPVVRELPDTRPNGCKEIKYDYEKLPTVSIVSPMFNEPLSSLLRHVHSLLARSPRELLHEIILVDDFSTYAYIDHSLEAYFKVVDERVKVVRNEKREGLVRTRMRGAYQATGEVIVFLDSHMEVNVGWLEPLVSELLKGGETTVVQPDAVGIDSADLEFSRSEETPFRGGFGWDMRYSWFIKPDYLYQQSTSESEPFPTPVLVGCAVAVWRNHFLATGGFDPGLEVWGGEHFELSFKTWMTGGKIFTVPCSKVGHIYKSGGFVFEGDFITVLKKNLVRVAEVWMDDYKEIYFASQFPRVDLTIFTPEELVSVAKRKELRRNLKSQSFESFLHFVMPEMRVPAKDAVHYGEISNQDTKLCITVLPSGLLSLTDRCFKHRILPENQFTINRRGQFLHDGKCIYPSVPHRVLKTSICGLNVTEDAFWRLAPGPWAGNIQFTSNISEQPLCVIHNQIIGHLKLINCSRHTSSFWEFQYYFQFPIDDTTLKFHPRHVF